MQTTMDSGVSETGIDGVQIRLTGKNDLNENVEITVTTAGGGNYTFTGLRPSDVDGYTITQVAEPAGYLDGKDRDGSLGNGVATNNQISSINVAPGNNGTSYNFGEVIASTLSGYVYHDSNNDGIRAGEPVGSGIANSTITLTGTDDLGQSVNLSTTTDADGFWQFTGLRPSNCSRLHDRANLSSRSLYRWQGHDRHAWRQRERQQSIQRGCREFQHDWSKQQLRRVTAC
jgi:hypothetical protein